RSRATANVKLSRFDNGTGVSSYSLPQSCASEPLNVRGSPCGKRVRWLGWSRLTDLALLQNLNYAEKRQALSFCGSRPSQLSGNERTAVLLIIDDCLLCTSAQFKLCAHFL